MEQSIIPVIRSSTAPVLPYFLITLRDQPYETIEPILRSAVKLVNMLKAQQPKDTLSQGLKDDLTDGLYILNESCPREAGEDGLRKNLAQILSVS